METTFTEMDSIFNRTKKALAEFMELITPIIEHAKDEHERLYWHHIYEEEEHRADRLDLLLPKIEEIINDGVRLPERQIEFVHLLQDISLEKFGLHNFLEHLDLSLFQFKGTEFEENIQTLRDFTYEDYQRMKVILDTLNQEFHVGIGFKTSIPTDEKEENGSNVKVDIYSQDLHAPDPPKQNVRKTLTVGSLKQR
jgi:hypothetical protein